MISSALQRSLLLSLLFVCAIIAASLPGKAQDPLDTTGRLKILPQQHRSGFLRENEVPTGIFFSTPSHGYYAVSNGSGTRTYMTVDGGNTWDTTPKNVPIPHTMLGSFFGFSSDGQITTDDGRTWVRMPVAFPDQSLHDSVTEMVAGSSTTIAVLYRAQRNDTPFVGYCQRIALTIDGGKRWQFIDSTKIVVDTVGSFITRSVYLTDTIAIGALPYPPGTIARKHQWLHLLWMDDSTLVFTSRLDGKTIDGSSVVHTYIWKVDLRTGKGLAIEIPIERIFGSTAGPNPVMLNALEGYCVQQTSLTPQTLTIWWTDDLGQHWDSVPAPLWLDYQSIRFLSRTFGITTNGITTDGGRTWTKWATPFAPRLFQAIDSTHFVGADNPSVFMRSSDAGRSWTVNDAAIGTSAILARGSDVLMARAYQSMLKSSDSGETFREVGRNQGIPSDVQQIEYMVYPDTSNHAHIMAIGTFLRYDGSGGTGILESRDGGETWKEGMALPELDLPVTSFAWAGNANVVTIQFVQSIQSRGLVGFLARDSVWMQSLDSGTTWTRTATLPFVMKSFSMADSRHGAAAPFVPYGDPGGIWMTSDGGANWTWTQQVYPTYNNGGDVHAFDSLTYRARFVDQTQGTEWRMYSSNDAGRTWSNISRRDPSMFAGPLLWLDTAQVYNFGGTSSSYLVSYSSNGGGSYTAVGRLDTSAVATLGIGVPYSYYAFGNTVARFRIVATPQGNSGVEMEPYADAAVAAVIPNVAHRGEKIRVHADAIIGTSATLELCDAMGRMIDGDAASVTGDFYFQIPPNIASGYYVLRLGNGKHLVHLPILVID